MKKLFAILLAAVTVGFAGGVYAQESTAPVV